MILQKNTANRLGIFVFYDKDGIADEYNFYFIEELKNRSADFWLSAMATWRKRQENVFPGLRMR